MKLRIPKRQTQDPIPVATIVAHCCDRLDHHLPHLRTALLITGLIAALLDAGTIASYLIGAGLLLHWAIWFQAWWGADKPRR